MTLRRKRLAIAVWLGAYALATTALPLVHNAWHGLVHGHGAASHAPGHEGEVAGTVAPHAHDHEQHGPVGMAHGRGQAVANLGRLRFGGFAAWLTWIFVHIAYLIGFRNRLLVLIEWAWSYVTYGRGARLITGETGEYAARVPSRP